MKLFLSIGMALLLVACGGSSSAPSPSSGNADTSNPGDSGTPGAGGSTSGFGEPLDNQVRPGVRISADGSSCTSNFLYQLNDVTVYLGVAAHCFSPDSNQNIDPCETNNLPNGFNQITIENASQPGVLVYSSWRAMQEAGETPGSETCRLNDFALVQLNVADIANIHPAVRAFGGPVSLARGVVPVGTVIHLYGRSSNHGGNRNLETMTGEVVSVSPELWSYDVVTDSPAVPGDSGGPVLDAAGRALAVTSVLSAGLSVNPLRNGVVNLDKALSYAKQHGFIQQGVQLMTYEDFSAAGDL